MLTVQFYGECTNRQFYHQYDSNNLKNILSCSFVICFTLKICHIYIYSIHKRVCISYLNIRKILSVKHFDSVWITGRNHIT